MLASTVPDARRFVSAGLGRAPTGVGVIRPFLAPPAQPDLSPVVFGVADPDAPRASSEPDDSEERQALARLERRLRDEELWWPQPRPDARRVRVLMAAPDTLADLPARFAAAASFWGRDAIAVLAPSGRSATVRAAAPQGVMIVDGASQVAADTLEAVCAPPHADIAVWAGLGGRAVYSWEAQNADVEWRPSIDRGPPLAQARFVDPWRGCEIDADAAGDALAFFADAARRNRKRAVCVGFSSWRQACAAPFLSGPAGAPRNAGTIAAALSALDPTVERLALWSVAERETAAARAAGIETIHLEDGFLRSVGLGLQNEKPASLALSALAPYFCADRPTDLEALGLETVFDDALLARARALRAEILARRLTKYNLVTEESLPEAAGREKVLVPGQVEGDASLRYGAPEIATNAALLARARERHPDAFLIYKPHPDVLTGLRAGAVPEAQLARDADHVAIRASAATCLDWADRVETMTSLMGFEALLRGKTVATHGAPFYAGWGLTEDLIDRDRGRRLSLDELVALALILHPAYVDWKTGQPAPVEVILDRLEQARREGATLLGRLRTARNKARSWVMNRF